MARRAKAGRPRKEGARYPCGQLKPLSKLDAKLHGEPLSPTLVKRMFDDVIHIAEDKRWADEVGRLVCYKELTHRQASAAYRLAQLQGSYEAMNGLGRSARSPSYELGVRGSAFESDDDRALREAKVRSEFAFIQTEIPHPVRGHLEQLVCESRAIPSRLLDWIRGTLELVADAFARLDRKDKRAGKQKTKWSDVPKVEIRAKAPLGPRVVSLDDKQKAQVLNFARALAARKSYRSEQNVRVMQV